MKQPLFTAEARIDLAEITIFLVEEAGIAIARKVIRNIKAAGAFLNQTPGAGHILEDLTDKPVRFWHIPPYLLIYDPAPQPITILRVLHGSRDVLSVITEDER